MKATRTFGVARDPYELRCDYQDDPTEQVACPHCGRPLTVRTNRATIPDHLMTNTTLGCTANGAGIRRHPGGRISLRHAAG